MQRERTGAFHGNSPTCLSFLSQRPRVTIPDAVQLTIHAQKQSVLQIAVYRQMVDLRRSDNTDSSARLDPQPGSKLPASRIEIALAS